VINVRDVEKDLKKTESRIQEKFIFLEQVNNELFFSKRQEADIRVNQLPQHKGGPFYANAVTYHRTVRYSISLWERDFNRAMDWLDSHIEYANRLEDLIDELRGPE
jgi:hypothetical protein